MAGDSDGSVVVVTGASGFVGGHVVRELASRGRVAVCPVRDAQRLTRKTAGLAPEAVVPVEGTIFDERVLARCLENADAVIHLVGIIEESRLRGQTFSREHVDATDRVVRACVDAGVKRYVHMSALGARSGDDEVSTYHRTKWLAEEAVRASGLDWTIFRPSVIHGPDGEFMQMMKFFATSRIRQPVMPYFGRGESRIQPVHVKDVASCFVGALDRPETFGKAYDLGGPERYTWKELYDTCAEAIIGRRRTKCSVPVPVARLLARVVMPIMPSAIVPYKFNLGQVLMSQEDSVCETAPIEETFEIKLRPFRRELGRYAEQIR